MAWGVGTPLVRGCMMEASLGSAVCLVVVGVGSPPDDGLGVSASAFSQKRKKKAAGNLLVFTMLWKQTKRKPAQRLKKFPWYQLERQEIE